MIIEVAFHDIDTKDIELKTNIINIIKYQPDYISVLPYYLKLANKTIQGCSKITCPIDYPLGISDPKNRQNEIYTAIKNGANKVDVVIPTLYLVNKKYDKFREDIVANIDICKSHNIELTYILEYRVFNHMLLARLCNILLHHDINTAYASTGHMLDDITDNTIASMYLAKKTNIRTIINGNIWNKNQIKKLCSYAPYGLRLNNIYSLQQWHDHQTQER